MKGCVSVQGIFAQWNWTKFKSLEWKPKNLIDISLWYDRLTYNSGSEDYSKVVQTPTICYSSSRCLCWPKQDTKTLSNIHSLISFKTIKIFSNFVLTIANWSISRSRNLENIRKIKITCFREVQGHWDFFYINCITFRHFSI